VGTRKQDTDPDGQILPGVRIEGDHGTGTMEHDEMETASGVVNLDIGVENAGLHPSPRGGTVNIEGARRHSLDGRDRPHPRLNVKEMGEGTIDMRTPSWLHKDRGRM